MFWMSFMGFAVISAGAMLFNAGRSSDMNALTLGGALVAFLGVLLVVCGISYNIGYAWG